MMKMSQFWRYWILVAVLDVYVLADNLTVQADTNGHIELDTVAIIPTLPKQEKTTQQSTVVNSHTDPNVNSTERALISKLDREVSWTDAKSVDTTPDSVTSDQSTFRESNVGGLNVVTEISVRETKDGQTINRKPTDEELRAIKDSLSLKDNDVFPQQSEEVEDLSNYFKGDSPGYSSDDPDPEDQDIFETWNDDDEDSDNEDPHDMEQILKEEEPAPTDESNKEGMQEGKEGTERPGDYRKIYHTERKNFKNVKEVKIMISETEGDFFDDDDFSSDNKTKPETTTKSGPNIDEHLNVIQQMIGELGGGVVNTTTSTEIPTTTVKLEETTTVELLAPNGVSVQDLSEVINLVPSEDLVESNNTIETATVLLVSEEPTSTTEVPNDELKKETESVVFNVVTTTSTVDVEDSTVTTLPPPTTTSPQESVTVESVTTPTWAEDILKEYEMESPDPELYGGFDSYMTTPFTYMMTTPYSYFSKFLEDMAVMNAAEATSTRRSLLDKITFYSTSTTSTTLPPEPETTTSVPTTTEQIITTTELTTTSSTTTTTPSTTTTTTTVTPVETTTLTSDHQQVQIELTVDDVISPADVASMFNDRIDEYTSIEEDEAQNEVVTTPKSINWDNATIAGDMVTTPPDPVLKATILNNTAEFSVKIGNKNGSYYIPDTAYVTQLGNVVNITWKVGDLPINSSIVLSLIDSGSSYSIKEITSNLVFGNQLITQQQAVSLQPGSELPQTRMALLQDGTFVTFSSVDFLRKNLPELSKIERNQKLWHVEVASICLATVVIIAVVLYVIALRTKTKITLREKDEVPQVTHC